MHVLCDSGTDGRTIAIHDIDNLPSSYHHSIGNNEEYAYTRREASLVNKVAHLQCSQRGELRRLENNCVSCGESRAKLPGDHIEREIPWDDLADYTDGFVTSITKFRFVGLDGLTTRLIPEVRVRFGIFQNRCISLRPPAVVPQNGSRLSHIEALADGERLAIVEGFER